MYNLLYIGPAFVQQSGHARYTAYGGGAHVAASYCKTMHKADAIDHSAKLKASSTTSACILASISRPILPYGDSRSAGSHAR